MGAFARVTPPPSTKVTYLGHASLLFESQGEVIVVDPVFSPRIARFFTRLTSRSTFLPEELRGTVGILISHAHHDHLDYPSLKRFGKECPIVVPWGIERSMRLRGYKNVRTIRRWEELALGRWKVTAVPARHFGGRIPYLFTSGYQGYVLSGPATIYFAGDTGFDAGIFREIRNRFRIDLAVLPIAGSVFPGYRRNHMNAEDALRAFRALGARRMLPVHYGTYPASFESSGVARQRILEASRSEGAATGLELVSEGASIHVG